MLPESIKQQLLKVSSATIDRILKPNRARYKRHGLTGTKPGYLLKNQIEIKTDHWDVKKPGFIEADTVAHCGHYISGDYVWSLTMTDMMTCWTEIRATWSLTLVWRYIGGKLCLGGLLLVPMLRVGMHTVYSPFLEAYAFPRGAFQLALSFY